MSEPHTPGILEAFESDVDGDIRWNVGVQRNNEDSEKILFHLAEIQNGAPGDCIATEEANARRIVACWNSLGGIANPEAVKDLVAFVREIESDKCEYTGARAVAFREEVTAKASVIIAKLEGKS